MWAEIKSLHVKQVKDPESALETQLADVPLATLPLSLVLAGSSPEMA